MLSQATGQPNLGARYHPVAEEGVAVREIAEAIGRGLQIPVLALSPDEAAAHFGWNPVGDAPDRR